MKKIIILTLLLSIGLMHGQGREWHVKPAVDNYNTAGDGLSFATAWSIQNALNNPGGVIHAGDIIWLHGGDYKGLFTSSLALSGTTINYIRVVSYPGEWARLNGNIYTYIAPPSNRLPPINANARAATPKEESDSYRTDGDDDSEGVILNVKSKFVQYENFEITCLDSINRFAIRDTIGTNCDATNAFHQLTGINHAPPVDGHAKDRFVNLVIRNIPGVGMGSWKYADDTEIYGCLFYNNGYILEEHIGTCSAVTTAIIGKGPGIYTQNATASTSIQRIIRNNLFLNNYDSGILVWSATRLPAEDYVKNFAITKNVFVNNGGPQRDETANMLVKSNSQNGFNYPTNININNNLFYFTDRAENVSGLDVENTHGVTINNNFIFKGTTAATFTADNTNLSYHHNFYWGKYMVLGISKALFATNNWDFHDNKYYKWNAPDLSIFQIPDISIPNQDVWAPLAIFQGSGTYGYNTEVGSTVHVVYGENTHPDLLYLNQDETHPLPEDHKIFLTQNQYNPNVFYVSLFNAFGDTTLNDNITVDFSAFSIPANTYYRIRDAQDYFSATPITGNITANAVTFPMTLTSIERPIGFLETAVKHSAKDFAVFTIEFGCNNLAIDKVVANQTDNTTTTTVYEGKKSLTLGGNYVEGNTSGVISNITGRAGQSIVILPNSTVYKGANFLGKIEDPCPDLAYNSTAGATGFSRMNDNASNNQEKASEKETVKVSPNPSSGIFEVKSLQDASITRITVSGINAAKVIFERSYDNVKLANIDIAKEPGGLYIVKVFLNDNSSQTKTFIKK